MTIFALVNITQAIRSISLMQHENIIKNNLSTWAGTIKISNRKILLINVDEETKTDR